MINNLSGLLDLKDFNHPGRRPGGRGAARGRGGFAGSRKEGHYDQRQAGRQQDFSYSQHGGYGSSMGQMPMHMFVVPQPQHPGPLPSPPYYGMHMNPNSPPAYPPPQHFSGYNYQAPENPPGPKRLRGGTPR